ncbi:unnamed protein product [Oppiella nova]|uniref:Cytochrome P450 n=1 Tax=Oppiella nova TaxID=334625 RepID=A0A7R9MIF8_9ACAR|nr:unnamed protein product [Oppiella nova]CAG2176989.1 unnamed protein product [Oppiella nova]
MAMLFLGNTPVVQVGDSELIKQILVKDFYKFVNRTPVSNAKHPILCASVGSANGDEWRRLRSIVSPTFTSAKMKRLYPLVGQSVNALIDVMDTYAKRGNGVEVRQMYGSYIMDVIANCAYGIKINAFKDPNDPFVMNAKLVINQSFVKLFCNLLLREFVLNVLNLLSMKLLFNSSEDYNVDENDILESHHVTEGGDELAVDKNILDRNHANKKLTENEIIAQAFNFFLAGYETTRSILSFCTYKLALNPRAQHKLYEEVVSAVDSDGQIEYEVLVRLPKLDAILSETLRLYSSGTVIKRKASEEIKLGDTGITLEKGMALNITAYAMYHSDEYFPNAEAFIPERFLPENRHQILPYTYLPFGNCVSMRFALLLPKLVLAHVIRRFRFVWTSQTDVPLVLNKFIRLKSPKSMIVGIESRD